MPKNDGGHPEGWPRQLLHAAESTATRDTARRPASVIAARATTALLDLEGALLELTRSGDSEYAASAIWLAGTRIRRHFSEPFRAVLEEWGLPAT